MATNRRTFLSAATLTALTQSRILGANDRVRIGLIGTGGRSRELVHGLEASGGNEVVAACDVYEPRRKAAIAKAGSGSQDYADYHQLLDRKDIDAVVIAAPDHWHVPMTMDAVAAGKDVYVEKPVTHTLEEGDPLIKAVRATDRIVQCGMQQRSWEHFRTAAEMIQSGKLGKVTQVRTYWFQNYHRASRPEVDVSKLDWKRWLGSAPDQPFEADRFYIWRWYWEFGGGAMTDLFTHWIDVVHMAMKTDAPRQAQMIGSRYQFTQRDCPDTLEASFEYPGFLVSYDGTMISSVDDGGLEFRGTEATMKLTREYLRIYPEGKNWHAPSTEIVSKQNGTDQHMGNFLECVRTRKQPNAPVETGVAAARPGHIGNLAYRKEARWINQDKFLSTP
jgi:predicted dehydrogenase